MLHDPSQIVVLFADFHTCPHIQVNYAIIMSGVFHKKRLSVL